MVLSPLNVFVICSLMNAQWRFIASTSVLLSFADSSDSAVSTHGSPSSLSKSSPRNADACHLAKNVDVPPVVVDVGGYRHQQKHPQKCQLSHSFSIRLQN